MPKVYLPSLRIVRFADDYLEAAKLVERNMMDRSGVMIPACVMAGFSIELYLKSFLAEDASTLISSFEGVDLYAGNQKAAHGHHLLKLFEQIPQDLKDRVLEVSASKKSGYPLLKKLEKFSDYFFKGRYPYEPGSIPVYDSGVLDTAEHLSAICWEMVPKAHQAEELDRGS